MIADTVDLFNLSVPERRRVILSRSIEKFRAIGTPIDADDRFMLLIERWIAGELEMNEVARLWRNEPLKLTARQSIEGAAIAESGLASPEPVKLPLDADTSISDPEQVESVFSKMSQEELIRAIDDITSGFDRTAPTD